MVIPLTLSHSCTFAWIWAWTHAGVLGYVSSPPGLPLQRKQLLQLTGGGGAGGPGDGGADTQPAEPGTMAGGRGGSEGEGEGGGLAGRVRVTL